MWLFFLLVIPALIWLMHETKFLTIRLARWHRRYVIAQLVGIMIAIVIGGNLIPSEDEQE